MKITDLLDPRSISLDAAPTSKSETLDKAVELMAASGKLSDVEAFRKQVYAREEESTTGIGEGIAIPHGKCDAVKKPGLAAMVIKNGVDFDSLDGEPVTLLFLIAAPNTKDNVHLDVLSKLSVLMMDENFSDSLRNASSVVCKRGHRLSGKHRSNHDTGCVPFPCTLLQFLSVSFSNLIVAI